MATGVVMPLNGEEILEDVLDQIAKKLRTDCNLRSSDAYSGGYSGKVTVSLLLMSVDNASVAMEIPISSTSDPLSDEYATREQNIEAEVDIPVEPNLDEVRERSGQGVPMQTLDPTTGVSVTKKRNYARRAEGGAL